MINLILAGLLDLIEESIKVLFGLFTGIFDFSLQKFANMFPIAGQLYEMLRAIGIGLIIAIAIFQLFKYFVGPMARTTEKPLVILLRAFFALFLVFMAPYVLEQIFNFTGLIFNDFATLEIDVGEGKSAVVNALDDVGNNALSGIVTWISGLGTAGVLFGIILGVVLAIQFVKMMLEIVERYLMTILLIYSSPLAMSTFTSESTSQILKKWISMFIAQCILLILSIWGVALFMNVLAVSTFENSDSHGLISHYANPVLSMIYAYAIVKIIKRMDNYLQQVGLNAAGMGGMSLLDSIAATAGGMKMFGGGAGGKGGKGGVFANAMDLKRHSGLYQGLTSAVANRGNGRSWARNFFDGSMSATGPTATGVAGSIKRGVERASAFGPTVDAYYNNSGEPLSDKFVEGVATASAVKPTTYHSFAEAKTANEANLKKREELANLSAQKEKLATAKNAYEQNKTAAQAKILGGECANAWRTMQGASPETISESGIADSIKEAVQSDPYAARSMMSDIIKNGGGTIEGDLADAVYDSYAGNALEDYLDEGASRSDSSLTLSQNKTGNRERIEYSTQYKKTDGQMYGLRAGNKYSSLVKQDKDGKPELTKNGQIITSSTLVDIDFSRPNSALGGTAREPVFVKNEALPSRGQNQHKKN